MLNLDIGNIKAYRIMIYCTIMCAYVTIIGRWKLNIVQHVMKYNKSILRSDFSTLSIFLFTAVYFMLAVRETFSLV